MMGQMLGFYIYYFSNYIFQVIETSPEQPPGSKFFTRIYEFDVDDFISITGPDSIWGRSLLLESPTKDRICATIVPETDETQIRVAEAR